MQAVARRSSPPTRWVQGGIRAITTAIPPARARPTPVTAGPSRPLLGWRARDGDCRGDIVTAAGSWSPGPALRRGRAFRSESLGLVAAGLVIEPSFTSK